MDVIKPTQEQFELIDNSQHLNNSGDLTTSLYFQQDGNNDWFVGLNALTNPDYLKKFSTKNIDDNGTMKSIMDILNECSTGVHVTIPEEL